MKINLPTKLSLLRIIAGPIIFYFIVFNNFFLAFVLFLIGSITDFLDGFIARKLSQESELGAIIDPIADKILVTFTLVGLSLEIDLAFISFLIGLIISRDIFVSGLRMFNLKNNLNHTEVTFLAKLKTAFQFFSISSYLLAFYLNLSLLIFISHFLLTFACLLTIKTGLNYTKASLSGLSN